MKLSNLKIGTRLTIGFILVILQILIIGGMALHQMAQMAGLVNQMYEHPLTTGNTMRNIRSEIEHMHDQVQLLLFINNAAALDAVKRKIDASAQRVQAKFDRVEERYSGDKRDVIVARKTFNAWKKKLDDAFAAVRRGDTSRLDKKHYEAFLKRTNALTAKLQVVIDFASDNAQRFLNTAHRQLVHDRWAMAAHLGVTLLLSLIISWLITRSIAPPLELIVRRMQGIARGDLQHDLDIQQKDEIGKLAESFHVMRVGLHNKADVAMAIAAGDLSRRVAINGRDDHLGNAIDKMSLALQESKKKNDQRDWFKSGKNELNRIIVGQSDLKVLATQMLSFFAGHLAAQIGTLYVISGNGELVLYGSYATGSDPAPAAIISPGEGLVGQAAMEKKIIVLTDIPNDYLRIGSSLGDALPRHIIAVPLIFEGTIQGVMELGAIDAFSEDKLDFLNDTFYPVAIAVHNAQNQAKRDELLKQTQAQARQLQVQEEELRVANEELEEQTHSLRKSEYRLKQQQEELRAINEELEEKNESLEAQKEQIARKNEALEEVRRELEHRARELEVTGKYKSEFLANMSHELRTPLNSLLLLSRDLEKNAPGNMNPQQVESAAVIHKSGLELLQLINEVLDLSKIEAGRMALKIEDIPLSEVTAAVEQRFKPMAAQQGLFLEIINHDPLPPSIQTDGQRLQQILNNLIGNALKFTDHGGVTLSVQRPGGGTNLTESGLETDNCLAFGVTDTGVGIPADKQAHIFEAFQQADGGTSRKYGGTGLGLSIARELAKLLDGEIQLDSTPGEGSTFTLFLPLVHVPRADTEPSDTPSHGWEKASACPQPPENAPPSAQLENLRSIPDDRDAIAAGDRSILIIEDDADFAKILLDQCHAKGFKALVAASGENGLRLADKYMPDAAILDIRLPGMSGCTVLRTLKNDPATRHIPVHIITVEETSLENMQGGAVGFTTKPVSRQELEQAFEGIAGMVEKKIKDLLLVEDNAELRRGIVNLIGEANLNIVEVDSGATAMDALQEKRFDCMILDLGLPDMSGFELLERMAAATQAANPPVIVYTGRELTREEEVALRRHAETIIVKGVKSEERLLDEVSLFLHKTVNEMPPASRELIITLHERDAMFTGKTILLVDDDMRNLFALSKILAEKGMNVLKAEDGRKALTLLDAHPETALVLLDVMMPVMDGYQTARQIRKQSRFYDLPIIALTAKALKDDRNKCIEAGANDYLSKPVDMERLFSMLRVWLYRRECVL
jgi:CheY-like chemotaxis protein/HAMP domain-containing protein